ncbi:MAG: hypothetical protein ACJ8BF_02310 [Gemmatimonadales bacterium]
MNPVQLLLRQSIDYAGLFPPAALDMTTAVANYAGYGAGPENWALGRFILPVSRLNEFEQAFQQVMKPTGRWSLSALPGPDLAADLDRIAAFNVRSARRESGTVIDTIELKSSSVTAIEDMLRRKPDDLQAYFELPIDRDPGELASAVAEAGGRAKVRTGGVTPDAFPSTSDLSRFIHVCVRSGLPFKATAGLHHALRAEYPLTYEERSARGMMFGFLNLFMAAAFIRGGMTEREVLRLLEESSPTAIEVDQLGIGWRGHRLGLEAIGRAREAIVSFGSCSFTEPIGELQSLHLLESRAQRA